MARILQNAGAFSASRCARARRFLYSRLVNGRRVAGLLLHPTSLPGRFGIGDVGPEARRFADFLAGAAQALWQVLPLGPTGWAFFTRRTRSATACWSSRLTYGRYTNPVPDHGPQGS